MQDAIQKLLKERYYLDNENNWDDIAKRVSVIYPKIYNHIKEKEFIPSTPTLMNANTKGKRLGTLSSCFTMGIDDSIEGIFESIKESAIVTKYGGGVGFDFSSLRSSIEDIKSIDAKSSGPIPFMRVLNATLDGIMQGGRRRGAGMGMLRVDHPDIINFITIKSDKTELQRLNLSIKITNKFYQELEKSPDKIHQVKFKNGTYVDCVYNGKIYTVKDVWDLIVKYAHENAEPGIINEDIAYNQCTVTNLSDNVLTNPCSEFVNIAYASCNLGSINLIKCIDSSGFNWSKFEKLARTSTRFLNNIIDQNIFPISKIEEVTKKVRPIGLGVMGWAHLLYLLGIPFNSKEADILANELYNKLTYFSMHESMLIAKETGMVYPAFDYDLFIKANKRFFNNEYNNDIWSKLAKDIELYGVANSCFTSIAPTGSISYIANASSGIEPVFALSFGRKIEKLDKQYETVYITDPVFKDYLNANYLDEEIEEILSYVDSNKGSCQGCELIPEKDQKVFVVAGDLTPMEHLNSLGIVARNTSLSVSKTINLPSNATLEEVSEVYLNAYRQGVIGVTVYRDGCRDGVLIHKEETEKSDTILEGFAEQNRDAFIKEFKVKRPRVLDGKTYQIQEENSHRTYMTVNHIEQDEVKKPWEIFLFSSSKNHELYAAIGRLASRLMRKTGDAQGVIDDLREIGGDHGYFTQEYGFVNSKPQHFSYILEEYVNGLSGTSLKEKKVINDPCPECGEKLIRASGCVSCSSCSFSKCG